MSERSVLFLSHAASRNGATLLLLQFMQWLAATTDWRLEVVCMGGGPVMEDFRKVATVHRCPSRLLPSRDASTRRDQARELLFAAALRALMDRRRYDLVYANTAAAWPLVAVLGQTGDALLWHIHELPYALGLSLASARARASLATATRFVAVSGLVRDALASGYAIDRERVDVVHGFVPEPAVGAHLRAFDRRAVLARLGWPDDSVVVGACGGPGWRKGSDLFLQAARLAVDRDVDRPLRFLWVGGADDALESRQFDHDVLAMGLSPFCRRIGLTDHVDGYYAAMDLFALPSREDPFPLVMLEAAMHELPTLCFADAGGGSEFVGLDAGVTLPYADVGRLAEAIVALARADAARFALGHVARRRALLHHRVESQGPLLLDSMQRCLSQVREAQPAPLHA